MENNLESMTYDEFVEKFVKTNKQWKFDQFSIVCKKCGSNKVEFNGNLELEYGWYEGEDSTISGGIVVKCHDCGNAFTLDHCDLTKH